MIVCLVRLFRWPWLGSFRRKCNVSPGRVSCFSIVISLDFFCLELFLTGQRGWHVTKFTECRLVKLARVSVSTCTIESSSVENLPNWTFTRDVSWKIISVASAKWANKVKHLPFHYTFVVFCAIFVIWNISCKHENNYRVHIMSSLKCLLE